MKAGSSRSPQTNTRDQLKAFLMQPDFPQQFKDQLFRVLDMERTGNFMKDDLKLYLGFFQESTKMIALGEGETDKLIQSSSGQSNRMTFKQLD